ncbi:MAG: hypothetical protein Q8T09_03030 [Candidatus Melainabacteria bacterium]|nr:hypothetical protein [Candidatus Melainabacteria bacterium]
MKPEEHLAKQVLNTIINRYEMKATLTRNGEVALNRWWWQLGTARLYTDGLNLDLKVVTIDMAIPALGLNSFMLYAFTGQGSATPHFAVDSVARADTYAIHCDLVPRVDSLHQDFPGYLEEVFAPIKLLKDACLAIPGVKSYGLSEGANRLLSPHQLCFQAKEVAVFEQIFPIVNKYLERWLDLVDNNSPANSFGANYLETYDRTFRSQMFSPEVDPIWIVVPLLLGRKTGRDLRTMLQTGDMS